MPFRGVVRDVGTAGVVPKGPKTGGASKKHVLNAGAVRPLSLERELAWVV